MCSVCALQHVRACRPTQPSTPTAIHTGRQRGEKSKQTYLLHDTSLALGKGNVTTRLVLDELDLNLSSLAAGLVVVVIVVVGSGARALDAAVLHAELAIAVVVDRRRRVLVVLSDLAGHGGCGGQEGRGLVRVWRTRALNWMRPSVGSWQAFLRGLGGQAKCYRTNCRQVELG